MAPARAPAWLLQRRTALGQRTRRDLLRVAGVGWALLVVLLWWQAQRGQALLQPDGLTLGAGAALAVLVAAAAGALLRSGRRATPAGAPA